MLRNNLTLDEEDAVQAELRELQLDVVSLLVWFNRSMLTFPQLQVSEPPVPITLPTVPAVKPHEDSAIKSQEEYTRIPVAA
jgi:charged multivesicular body protein 6